MGKCFKLIGLTLSIVGTANAIAQKPGSPPIGESSLYIPYSNSPSWVISHPVDFKLYKGQFRLCQAGINDRDEWAQFITAAPGLIGINEFAGSQLSVSFECAAFGPQFIATEGLPLVVGGVGSVTATVKFVLVGLDDLDTFEDFEVPWTVTYTDSGVPSLLNNWVNILSDGSDGTLKKTLTVKGSTAYPPGV